MAINQHSTSRRAIIKALGAAPVIATASVVEAAAMGGAFADRSSAMNMTAEIFDISPATRWEWALATYLSRHAQWASHPYARTLPTSPDYETLQAEEEVIADSATEALKLLLRTPVPGHAAFVEKMEVFEREFEDMSEGYFAHLIADARRLTRFR